MLGSCRYEIMDRPCCFRINVAQELDADTFIVVGDKYDEIWYAKVLQMLEGGMVKVQYLEEMDEGQYELDAEFIISLSTVLKADVAFTKYNAGPCYVMSENIDAELRRLLKIWKKLQ
eukprot:TRINITY_DN110_c0_g1_i18.p4 TRINITY_DN110_c0_g1~~TRINITY_DN110_c0_g1_i18.p4  ORF type:complete len:117 (-),score=0.17 TRINITY_DN110_c0_g1_i18:562-912(-)